MSSGQPLACREGVMFEQKCALLDTKMIIDERGISISINIIDETDVTRDKYNSIKQRETSNPLLTLFAYPLIFSPTNEDKSDAGLREITDVIAHTAMLDWTNAKYNIDDIDLIRTEVFISGDIYEVKDKAKISQFGDTYLYFVLGLNKK